MDISQRLEARLAEHVRRPMMPPGSEDLASAALAEIKRLRALVQQGREVVEDFMPNIARCALQDYGRLNRFLIDATALKGEDS